MTAQPQLIGCDWCCAHSRAPWVVGAPGGKAQVWDCVGGGFVFGLRPMKLRIWRYDLRLTHRWAIARGLGPGGQGGADTYPVVFVELKNRDGVVGLGEAAPSARYDETPESVTAFLERVNPYQLSFTDLEAACATWTRSAHAITAPKGP